MFSERTSCKVRAPKFLAKKGLFLLMGTLKLEKTSFVWDFGYFMGSQEAREWSQFLPNPFFLDFGPKRTLLPNITFLSLLAKKLEQRRMKARAKAKKRNGFEARSCFCAIVRINSRKLLKNLGNWWKKLKYVELKKTLHQCGLVGFLKNRVCVLKNVTNSHWGF